MKKLLFAIAAVLLVAACAMPPEGTTPEDVAAFDAALASIGCDLRDESDFLPVELQTGLSRAQVQAMAEYKAEIGEMGTYESGGYRLLTGACADPAEAPAAA